MSLSGCIHLWDITKSEQWRARADYLCKLLRRIQRPDGGFDPGYDYNFGKFHRRGESISSELFSLSILVRYYVRFGGAEVEKTIHRAADWIRQFAIQVGEDMWAIPYGPYSSRHVMVYNGTSFASGALGEYLSVFPDKKLEAVYCGMLTFLSHAMSECGDLPGKYWYYSDQSLSDLPAVSKSKVDYYHQMQQVEVHSRAQQVRPNPLQLEIIKHAAEHVLSLKTEDGVIPYLNRSGDIHLWGYCSCASGFLMAAKLFPDDAVRYRQAASQIIEWICTHAWNGKYFYSIVTASGQPVDRRYYVRSDAWVFNSLSLAVAEGIASDDVLEICDMAYQKMEKCNFSGIENHASCFRTRAVGGALKLVRRALGRRRRS